jgi:putative cardiolipin synthase
MSGVGRSLVAGFLIFASGMAVADSIRMYTSGQKSLSAHLEALSSAQHSIDIVTYEFKPCDASTKAIIAVLAKKAKEGVAVRVMLDDYSLSRLDKTGLAGYFAAMKIKFKIYNQSFLLGQNHRNHIKLTLIDGDGKGNPAYFADSSNFTDEYFGMSANRNYVNRDFKITGASVSQAKDAFEMLWNSRAAGRERKLGSARLLYDRCLKQTKRDVQVAALLTQNLSAWADSSSIYSCENVKYVADDPRFQDQGLSQTNDRDSRNEEYMNDLRLKRKHATKSFLEFVDGARRTLNIENQYYIPVYRMRRELEDLKEERDVRVLVLTNLTAAGISPASSRALSFFISKAARRDSKGEMAVLTLPSQGRLAKVNPLTPKNGGGAWHLHSKSMVRDHRDVWFGSFNIDPRSYHTNLEYTVTVRGCPNLAQSIEGDYKSMLRDYEADMKDCRECKGEVVNLNPFEVIGAFFTQNFL